MLESLGGKNIMNAVYNDINANYYASIKGIWLYVDYINNRLKIIDQHNLSEEIITEIIDFAKSKKLSKILLFCEKEYMMAYEKLGFIVEGYIKGFYKGTDAICLSCFVNCERKVSKHEAIEEVILVESLMETNNYNPKLGFSYNIRNANEQDIPQMIDLFKEVFATYPSPVNNPEYLREAMKERMLFKVALDDEKIIGIASADMDLDNLNAEITDCATYPQYRGRGILPSLIISLEKDLVDRDFITLYSLSRATNKGINKTLSKLGYEYNGRLINNCHICGDFEDMNIWTKLLNK